MSLVEQCLQNLGAARECALVWWLDGADLKTEIWKAEQLNNLGIELQN